MKTTIEIADDLLARARRVAMRERKTLRQLLESADTCTAYRVAAFQTFFSGRIHTCGDTLRSRHA